MASSTQIYFQGNDLYLKIDDNAPIDLKQFLSKGLNSSVQELKTTLDKLTKNKNYNIKMNTTETASGSYTSTEQQMLNNLALDVKNIIDILRTL